MLVLAFIERNIHKQFCFVEPHIEKRLQQIAMFPEVIKVEMLRQQMQLFAFFRYGRLWLRCIDNCKQVYSRL